MNNEIVMYETERMDSSSLIEIGQWYWVKDVEEDGDKQLCCITEIGSNYVKFRRYSVYKSKDPQYDPRDTEYSFRLHMDKFQESCQPELEWEKYFSNRIQDIQRQIKEKTNDLIQEGKKLYLISEDKKQVECEGNLLPAKLDKGNLEKYRNDLVNLKNKTIPNIQREIKSLSIDFAMTSKNMALSDISRLEAAQKQLGKIEDKIFTIELYTGIHEYVQQIADGEPGNVDDPISVRQQLLFMDEECLIDFNKGGMDFQRLEDFDKWIVRPENISRILPERKGIVAFQVRRKKKEYSIPQRLWEVFELIRKDHANMETYLLIRNGQKIYRIASAINFSPRLIPLKSEIGERQFQEVTKGWFNKEDTIEIITPDHINYDDHVSELEKMIQKYNRAFILIQGLLDRTDIFHPHPPVKLNKQEHMDLWLKCIRDEETGLPNNSVSIEEYRKQLNRSIKAGDLIYSNWVPDDIGQYSYRSDRQTYTSNEQQIVSRPKVCRVTQVKKDKASVWITWEVEVWSWPRSKEKRNRHLLIPIDQVFNLSNYTPGDYKMFLCDRALQGKYLQWAPALLTAEKMIMKGEL